METYYPVPPNTYDRAAHLRLAHGIDLSERLLSDSDVFAHVHASAHEHRTFKSRTFEDEHRHAATAEEAARDIRTKTVSGDVTPDDVVDAMIWPESATVSPTDATLLLYVLEQLTPVQNNSWDDRIVNLTEALKPHAVLCTYDGEEDCERWGTEERDGMPWCLDHEPHEVMVRPALPTHCGHPMDLQVGLEGAWWVCSRANCRYMSSYMQDRTAALRLVGVDV